GQWEMPLGDRAYSLQGFTDCVPSTLRAPYAGEGLLLTQTPLVVRSYPSSYARRTGPDQFPWPPAAPAQGPVCLALSPIRVGQRLLMFAGEGYFRGCPSPSLDV